MAREVQGFAGYQEGDDRGPLDDAKWRPRPVRADGQVGVRTAEILNNPIRAVVRSMVHGPETTSDPVAFHRGRSVDSCDLGGMSTS